MNERKLSDLDGPTREEFERTSDEFMERWRARPSSGIQRPYAHLSNRVRRRYMADRRREACELMLERRRRNRSRSAGPAFGRNQQQVESMLVEHYRRTRALFELALLCGPREHGDVIDERLLRAFRRRLLRALRQLVGLIRPDLLSLNAADHRAGGQAPSGVDPGAFERAEDGQAAAGRPGRPVGLGDQGFTVAGEGAEMDPLGREIR